MALMPLSQWAEAQNVKTFEVEVTNSWSEPKTNEPVVVKLNRLRGKAILTTQAEVSCNGTAVASQLDDMDGNGMADELVFLTNLQPRECKVFKVRLTDAKTVGAGEQTQPRVYADMMLDDKKGKHPFLTELSAPGDSYLYSDLYHHGAAFESELTGYRIYFDHRQNVDIYGKRQQRLELADTHFYTAPEQQAQNYGNDVLWAGSSVGCGSLKLWNDGPGDWKKVGRRTQRIVAAGPLRTVVEMSDYNMHGFDIRAYYLLYAGHRDVEVQVRLNHPIERPMFCTGVTRTGVHSETFSAEAKSGIDLNTGLAISWGKDYPEQSSDEMKARFAPEAVGMAVFAEPKYMIQTRMDESNCLLVIGKPGTKAFEYHITFAADKEQNSSIHDFESWAQHVAGWRESLLHKANVKVRKIICLRKTASRSRK